MPLVRSPVRRHARVGQSNEDLTQVGTLALIGAVDRYDPHRGGSSASFALPAITGELLRHVRDRAGSVRLPRAVTEARRAVVAAAADLRAETGHVPSLQELATRVWVSQMHVSRLLRRAIDSLRARVGSDEVGRTARAG